MFAALTQWQFFWALLVIALSGAMIAQAFAGNPSIINYDMFCGIFAMLSLVYLIPATLKENISFPPIIMIGLDALNMLFLFAAGTAMASSLGVHSCGNAVCFSPASRLPPYTISDNA